MQRCHNWCDRFCYSADRLINTCTNNLLDGHSYLRYSFNLICMSVKNSKTTLQQTNNQKCPNPVCVSAGSEGLSGGQGDGIPAPQKLLFPGNKLSMKWERVYRVGAGLHNLGNTCFLNSTVQCLTYTPPLANYLLSKEHSRSCKYRTAVMQAAQTADLQITENYPHI